MRGWEEEGTRRYCFMDTEFLFGVIEILAILAMAAQQWKQLMPLNNTLKDGYNSALYIRYILQQFKNI